jgi:hypothetical protein
MTLNEAIQIARKSLYGAEVSFKEKMDAYNKLAELHVVMEELGAIMGRD